MNKEDILEVLLQDYTHTITIYCYRGKVYSSRGDVSASDYRSTQIKILEKAECIINGGKIRNCFWDPNLNNETEEDQVHEGDICVNNFMFEIYRIYKTAEKDRTINDSLIQKAFSMALNSAVFSQATKLEFQQKMNKWHYLFVVPTDWEYGIRETIIRPIFKRAGLINENDADCSLLFNTELDALIYSWQNTRANDGDNEPDVLRLEKDKRYLLCDFKVDHYSHVFSSSCKFFSFDSVFRNNSNFTLTSEYTTSSITCSDIQPVGECRKLLLSLETIGSNLWQFLIEKGVFISSVATKENQKRHQEEMDSSLSVTNFLYELIVSIIEKCLSDVGYYEEKEQVVDSKMSYKDLRDKMSLDYPFIYWKLDQYSSLISIDKLKRICMLDMYNILLRDIEDVLEKSVTIELQKMGRMMKGFEKIIFAVNLIEQSPFDRDIANSSGSESNIFEDDKKYNSNVYGAEEKEQIEIMDGKQAISLFYSYIKWIFYLISLKLKCYANSDEIIINNTDCSTCFDYSFTHIIDGTGGKFIYNAALLTNILPILTLILPLNSKRSKQSNFSVQLSPSYIVQIDVALFRQSKFSYFKYNFDKKKNTATTKTNQHENIDDLCLPPLYDFLKSGSFEEMSCNNLALLVTKRLWVIMKTHFKHSISYFAKYDRYEKRAEVSPTSNVTIDESATKLHSGLCLLPENFEALVPEIISELLKESNDDASEKIKEIVEIRRQSYIKTFLMIYLAVLKYKVDKIMKRKAGTKNDSSEIIGYAISIDALLFEVALKESYDDIKELIIASGFAKDESDFKRNVRVITEREEQILPILQQESGTDLPLKSFYVHARLHERYIHISLNQVVKEGSSLPDFTNAKNIVIKSKIVFIKYLSDQICDNIWNAVQNCGYALSGSFCKLHYNSHTFLRELLQNEQNKVKKKLKQKIKKKHFAKKLEDIDDISISTCNFCGCKIHLTGNDIVNLGAMPAIKEVISIITGSIVNEEMFALYGIEHIFVTFNYFNSVFHCSYKEILKYHLKHLISLNLARKNLEIPFTVSSSGELNAGQMTPSVTEKSILLDQFLFGNLVQASSETYSLSFNYIKETDNTDKRKSYIASNIYQYDFKSGKYSVIPKNDIKFCILEAGDATFNITTGTRNKRVFYFKHAEYKTEDVVGEFCISISKSYPFDVEAKDVVESNFLSHTSVLLGDCLACKNNFSSDCYEYTPFFFQANYLNYCSFIQMSLRIGLGYVIEDDSIEEIDISSQFLERLTLVNTQYIN